MGPRDLALTVVDRAARAFGEGVARVRGAPAQRVSATPISQAQDAEGERSVFSNLVPDFFFSARLRIPTLVTRPYRSHPWLYAILSQRAAQVIQAKLRACTIGTDGETQTPLDKSDPLSMLLAKPNEGMDGITFMYLLDTWLAYLGEAFILLDRESETAEPSRMWVLPGGSGWEPGPLDQYGSPTAWVYNKGGTRIPYEPWQVIQVKYPDPEQPLRGIQPLLAAMQNVEADVLADRFTMEFFRAGAAPGGVLKFPKEMTPEQIKRVRENWQDLHGGAWNAHRVAVLYGGAEWQQTQISQRDMEFMELKKWSREALAAVYHWPLWMLTDSESSYATARESRFRLWRQTIIPILRLYESALNNQLFSGLRGGRVVAAFDLDSVPALVEERDAQWDTVLKMRQAGVTLQEADRRLGLKLKPQPGWDSVLVPLAQVPIEEVLAGTEEKLIVPKTPITKPPEEDQGFGAPAESDESEAMAQGALAALPSGERAAFKRRRYLWRKWNSEVRDPAEGRMKTLFRPYLRDLAEHQLKRFDKVAREKGRDVPAAQFSRVLTESDIEAILFDRAEWDATLRAEYRVTVEQIGRMAAAYTEGQLAGTGKVLDMMSPRVREFMDRRVQLVTKVNDATRMALRRQLQEAFNEGETVQEMRARIAAVSESLADPARTLRIARTEAGGISEGVAFQFGEPGDLKSWVSADDELVRPSHQRAEAESVKGIPVEQPFSNGLMHPNDPGAPASEVMNCRCHLQLLPREAA